MPHSKFIRPEIVWFDFGGVLSPPIPDLFEGFARRTGLASSIFLQGITDVADALGMPPLAPIELGLFSEAEWGDRIRIALERRHPDLPPHCVDFDTIGRQWFDGIIGNQTMIDAAHDLKAAGFRIGILTNNVAEWEPYWRPIAGLDEIADVVIDSCRVGWRKPDAQIFTIACETAGISASQCLLIDDLAENVTAAQTSGWQAIHFTGNQTAFAELTALTGVHFQAQAA